MLDDVLGVGAGLAFVFDYFVTVCMHQVVVDDIEKRLSQLLKHCQYIGVSRGAA